MVWTFILTLIMMLVNTTAKVMMNQKRNWYAVGLTGIDTFIFVTLISEKGMEFAIIYTIARVIGSAISLFALNKKKTKEYWKTFTVIPKNTEDLKIFIKRLQEHDNIEYVTRDINSYHRANEEVIVYSENIEISQLVKSMIPEKSWVIENKNQNVGIY